MPSLEFKNLPLVEVQARLRPEQPIDVGLGSLCEISGKLRDRYPIVENLEPLALSGGPSLLHQLLGQPAGARLSSSTSPTVATVQPTLITATWRSKSLTERDEYPRFSKLKRTIKEILAAMPPKTGYVVANISYTNFVQLSAVPTGQHAKKYLESRVLPLIATGSMPIYDLSFAWHSKDAGDLRVQIQPISGDPDASEPDSLLLTTTCGVSCKASEDPIKALQTAHDNMNETFIEMITAHAKEEWGYVSSD